MISLSQFVLGPMGKVSDKYVTHYVVRSPDNTEIRCLHKKSWKGG